MSDTPPVTVTQLINQQEVNTRKEQELKVKRAKIKAFQGLPPVCFYWEFVPIRPLLNISKNLELARHELRNARDEQMKLMQLRDRLLGRMAESVS